MWRRNVYVFNCCSSIFMLVEIFVFDSDIYQTCNENKEEEKILIIPMIREKMQMRSKNHIKLKKKKN